MKRSRGKKFNIGEDAEESDFEESDEQGDADELYVDNVNELKPTNVHEEGTTIERNKKPKKRRKNDDTDTSDEEHLLPTALRKTNNGGYSHTKRSRARISKANTGNTPWNKGRQRSEADKAKIAAAVRARNQAILREKLKKFNMTEEEFRAKQKEIKYLRERVRRAKLNMKKTEEHMDSNTLSLQVKLEEAIALRDRVVNTQTTPFEKKVMKKSVKRKFGEKPADDKVKDEGLTTDLVDEEAVEGDGVLQEDLYKQEPIACLSVTGNGDTNAVENEGLGNEIFPVKEAEDLDMCALASESLNQDEAQSSKDDGNLMKLASKSKVVDSDPLSALRTAGWSMEWSPHELDCGPPSCPNGGPSGLVCCEACSSLYSHFMSHTVEEMETRRIEEASCRVEELLGYIEETRMQLLVSTQAARKIAPPVPLVPLGFAKRTKMTRASSSENYFPVPTSMDWCVTSTLDMNNKG